MTTQKFTTMELAAFARKEVKRRCRLYRWHSFLWEKTAKSQAYQEIELMAAIAEYLEDQNTTHFT